VYVVPLFGVDFSAASPTAPPDAGGLRLTFDSLELRIAVADGRARITQWSAISSDVVFDLALQVALAQTLEDSLVTGCLRFHANQACAIAIPGSMQLCR
jgi:hypothetical protein